MRVLVHIAAAVAVVACLISAAGAGEPTEQMQREPGPKPRAEDSLEQAGRALLTAYAAADADKLFEALTAARRESAALALARLSVRLEENPDQFEGVSGRLHGPSSLDPEDKLKLESAQAVRSMRAADYFALQTGALKAASRESLSKLLKGRWFMIEREVGTAELRRAELRGSLEVVTRGYLVFENVPGNRISMVCAPDADGWRVASFEIKLGEFKVAFNGTLPGSAVRSPEWNEWASEGRAALGAMKDRARVVYQRTQAAKLGKNALGLGQTELNGNYYDDSCYTVTNSDVHQWIAMCKPKKAGSGPIVVVIADVTVAKAAFFEYADEAEMGLNPPTLEDEK